MLGPETSETGSPESSFVGGSDCDFRQLSVLRLAEYFVELLVDLRLDGALDRLEQEWQVDLDADGGGFDVNHPTRALGGAARRVESDSIAIPAPPDAELLLHGA